MVFDSNAPVRDGKYRWRAEKGARIHTVTVRTKRGVTSYTCSTMAVDTLQSSGEWSAVERAEEEQTASA